MIPQDFSYHLPKRCLQLLEALEANVPNDRGGPLRTTFLLSIAMPLITIPDQVLNGESRLVMRDVNRLRDGNQKVMQATFAKAPFRASASEPPDRWYYMELNSRPHHPRELEKNGVDLVSQESVRAVEQQATGVVLRQLRNALAHAGVIYLDQDGKYQPDHEAKMLAFISERGPAYSVLAVAEEDFSMFLRRWATWLDTLGANELAVLEE